MIQILIEYGKGILRSERLVNGTFGFPVGSKRMD
jgi:hypothetical protein